MARSFDGTIVPYELEQMHCGGVPFFDQQSGYAYRCDVCFAVIGSIGQSDECKDINAKPDHIEAKE